MEKTTNHINTTHKRFIEILLDYPEILLTKILHFFLYNRILNSRIHSFKLPHKHDPQINL